jgi:hypothetical protein
MKQQRDYSATISADLGSQLSQEEIMQRVAAVVSEHVAQRVDKGQRISEVNQPGVVEVRGMYFTYTFRKGGPVTGLVRVNDSKVEIDLSSRLVFYGCDLNNFENGLRGALQ